MAQEEQSFEQCCDNMNLVWKPSRVGDRHADMYLCKSCGHIHRMESWLIPVRFPKEGRCVNCGGQISMEAFQVAILRPGEKHGGPEPRCDNCGFSEEDDRALHDRLASLHPEGDYIAAAIAAAESGRHVLSLKLSSAELRWATQHELARAARIEALQAMEFFDQALDEAWDWSLEDPATSLWTVIAELEATRGNIEGALSALEQGLQNEPDNLELWTDYGELLGHVDSRPHAIEAAAYGLWEPALQPRCLKILTDMGERYYQEQLYLDALKSASQAGDLQESYLPLAWLRARCAAQQNQQEAAKEWLAVVLELDPDHEEALKAMEVLNPPRKKGWFGWGGKE